MKARVGFRGEGRWFLGSWWLEVVGEVLGFVAEMKKMKIILSFVLFLIF